MKPHPQPINPKHLNRQVRLVRPRNGTLRKRGEYLTAAEIEQLIKATRTNRNAHQDATLVRTISRHGLRASEACDLEWSQVEMDRNAVLHVRRIKNGTPSVHPIRGDELRALRQLQRQRRPRPSCSPQNAPARSPPRHSTT